MMAKKIANAAASVAAANAEKQGATAAAAAAKKAESESAQAALSPDEILAAVLGYQPSVEVPGWGVAQRLWPMLVGPTGAGKTTRVRRYAAEQGLPISTLLLESQLAEEVLGIPTTDSAYTVWALPEWARVHVERPGIIFLDEVDKARPEKLAAVLTLLAERRIRDTVLHSGTLFVLAGQPVSDDWLTDETTQALRARVVPIPIGYDWAPLGESFGVNLSFLPAKTVPIPALPEPSVRQVHYVLDMFCALPRQIAVSVAHNVLGSEWAGRLIEQMGNAIRPDLVAGAFGADPERVETAPLPLLHELLPYIFVHGTVDAASRALARVVGESSEDQAEEALKNLRNVLQAEAQRYEGDTPGMPILRGSPEATEDDWRRLVDSAARRIAERWKAVSK